MFTVISKAPASLATRRKKSILPVLSPSKPGNTCISNNTPCGSGGGGGGAGVPGVVVPGVGEVPEIVVAVVVPKPDGVVVGIVVISVGVVVGTVVIPVGVVVGNDTNPVGVVVVGSDGVVVGVVVGKVGGVGVGGGVVVVENASHLVQIKSTPIGSPIMERKIANASLMTKRSPWVKAWQ